MNDREQLLLEQWKMASQFHLQMDNNVWQGASYFVAINGILLGVLGAMATNDALFKASVLLRVILVAIPLFGAFISGVWTVVQRRAKLYTHYRMAQAKQAEEALTVEGERILTLHEKGIVDLSEQDFQDLKDPYLGGSGIYLKSWLGMKSPHDFVAGIAIFLKAIWIALFLVVSWLVFPPPWNLVVVLLVVAFLLLWLVWYAFFRPRIKRPPDQADA